jgi:pimeloyl-ACP methyl ester carboxylesterase
MFPGRAARSFIAFATLWLAACATTGDAPRPFESGRISVVTTGSGPDVVLIPGLATSRDVWRGTIAAVPGYRYHLIQIEGFAGTPPGRTPRPGRCSSPWPARSCATSSRRTSNGRRSWVIRWAVTSR